MIAERDSLLLAAQEGDEEACARMLDENSGLIWSVARRYFGRGVDGEDLYQLGCLGFLKAVRGFNPALGNQFSTYAVPKIAGEIRRFLRDDGPVKVSRTIKERAVLLRGARERLCHALGREPTLSELAGETGLTAEDIAAADLAVAPTASLQAESGENGGTLEAFLGSEGIEEKIVERIALRQAIERLPDQEKETIFLRFYKNLTQERAARVLGVSQVQVSRLERRAVTKLRRFLEEEAR
ncbi:MAG TPA: sigma-70 family RNA polymerase sigma factor [Oscillospiraceae bacterium]|nr:sigma-70 family RNA polymerase sigma factor [Oscillospiraceae bacterium]